MKRVDAWITSDGQIFTSERDAKRHADNRYGNALLKLAHKAVAATKYKDMGDFIEAHLAQFVELQALRDDIQVEADDNYEEAE